MNGCVMQEWVAEGCSWKEQTVLLCGLRGPDAGGTKELKAWTRWIRRTVLENAAPKKTFMQEEKIVEIETIADDNPLALDMLPVHYLSHLMHSLQVIGFRHPSSQIREIASHQYFSLAKYLHLEPEYDSAMTRRLEDEICQEELESQS